MNNFTEVTRSLVRSGAARIVEDAHTLEVNIKELIDDPQAREMMSKAGRAWHKKNRGSSKRIAKSILNELKLES